MAYHSMFSLPKEEDPSVRLWSALKASKVIVRQMKKRISDMPWFRSLVVNHYLRSYMATFLATFTGRGAKCDKNRELQKLNVLDFTEK